MASAKRRGSIGVDGAESQYCDLSGRGLTSGQMERTLRVFATADTIDLSNNEIDKIPVALPAKVVTLDISFNVIANIRGIERLKYVQQLHLAFNRLDDVSALEFCPHLVNVNLSGNRLMSTRGLETLEFLENLDLSDNLIEVTDALRPLSLNHNLTHLTIRGNPLSQRPGYHVPLLDMIPSVIMLDDKKMRSVAKYKTREVSAIKSLSYSRIYDDKKQYVIHKQARPRPATTVRPLLPGDPTSKYDGTMFLPPPVEPTHERARAGLHKFQTQPVVMPISPLPAPFSPHRSTVQSPSSSRATPYLSLYDRLAQSNGVQVSRSTAPPSKPIVNSTPVSNKIDSTNATRSRYNSQQTTVYPQKSNQPSSEGTRSCSTPRHSKVSRNTILHREPWQEPQRQRRPSSARAPGPSARPGTPSSHTLDDKQRNVLSVIQNLIKHKKQTLATLGVQKAGEETSARTQGYTLTGQVVR